METNEDKETREKETRKFVNSLDKTILLDFQRLINDSANPASKTDLLIMAIKITENNDLNINPFLINETILYNFIKNTK